MVDILNQKICNYCKNTKCKENKYCDLEKIEIKIDRLEICKCVNYEKDPSKIIPIERPLPITAKRDYIKYHEI